MDKLHRALRLLAHTRQENSDAKVDRASAHEAMLSTVEGREWQFCKELVSHYSGREKKLYDMAAPLVVASYDGEHKDVAPGAKVIDKKLPDTQEMQSEFVVTAWVKENAPALFEINWPAFWKMVEAGLVPEGIARIVPGGTETQARISKDLGFLLEDENAD